MEALSASRLRGNAEVWEIRIDQEADITAIRSLVRELTREFQFDPFAAAAITTAASELSRNVWVHAKAGIARIGVLRGADRIGVELALVDDGPGIADLDRVLAGGYSTANSLGIGLSGTKRLVDEFNIDTAPGRGTTIVIRKWRRKF